MEIVTNSPAETQKFAAGFVSKLKPGSVVALTGQLGAGKTCFIQGMALGLGVKKDYYVNSPTFTLLNIYKGGRYPLYHFDWYRLDSVSETQDLGIEEYFDGEGISVIEWAEKFPELLPAKTVWVKFEIVGESQRKIIIERGQVTP